MEGVINNLQDEDVFDRILIVNNYNQLTTGFKRVFVRSKELIVACFNREKIRRFVKGSAYDYYFTFGSNVESYFALKEISKIKKPVLAYYEEGVGSYVNKITYSLKFYHTFLLRATLTPIPDLPDEYWVYSPGLLKVDIPDGVEIKTIPYFPESLKETVNRVWGYSVQSKTDYDIILFDQPYRDDTRQIEVFKSLNSDRTVVKLHPRTPDRNKYNGVRTFPQQDCLWELSCLNNPGMGNFVLVSEFSTACFTPKCMFGMEPTVIFLLGMCETYSDESLTLYSSLIWALKHSYRDPERVHIVASVQEIKDILDKHQSIS